MKEDDDATVHADLPCSVTGADVHAARPGTGLVMNLAVGRIMMSTLVVGPFILAFMLRLNEALIGLVIAFGPVVAAIAGIPAGRLTDRLAATRVIVFSLVQTMLSGFSLPLHYGVGGYAAALLILTPAFQLFLAANNTAVLVGASKDAFSMTFTVAAGLALIILGLAICRTPRRIALTLPNDDQSVPKLGV